MSRVVQQLVRFGSAVAVVVAVILLAGTSSAPSATSSYRRVMSPIGKLPGYSIGVAPCPTGLRVVGGGFNLTAGNSSQLIEDGPELLRAGQGWRVTFNDQKERGTVYGICVS